MTRGIILLSAGGTGGHLFPAEALAHELRSRGWEVHLATDSRAERFASDFPASAVHAVRSATIGSRNPVLLARGFMALWTGFRQASALIGKLKPKAVVGFGGYPTLPPAFAATRRGVPTLIHEQNAVMGRANKALAGRVRAIAGGFLGQAGAHADKIVVTGNPVRPAVLEAAKSLYRVPTEAGPFRLLVFGGSQGARYFSEALPAAVGLLSEPLRARLRITQQARGEDEAEVKRVYGELGVEAEVAPFFTDLAARMAKSHLVVSRSGASTVSEIAVIGRPAILVPYPHALDHDQAANAAALAQAGGAEIHDQRDLTPERLADVLSMLMRESERLSGMAKAARKVGKPEAARLLADLAEAIAEGRSLADFRKDASQ